MSHPNALQHTYTSSRFVISVTTVSDAIEERDEVMRFQEFAPGTHIVSIVALPDAVVPKNAAYCAMICGTPRR